ncbi:undecaprenyl/decaprenyl-phosphate alpha-N-acetylglucosaminyl 1-phosphate transferase [Flavobacteriaceae bacterium]|nr:undecaprenyl/decaprenyl-phosphate alpha-N-acetylglucosaminyl 1-phosphate transferase [Flavobacteriaceae bacterium]
MATRTGGIGVFLTVLIISLFYYSQNIEIFDYSLFIPLGIMFIVGVYDDFYNADFKLKFLLQIIVAKILIDQGYVISNYYGIFGLYEVPWPLAQVTSVFVFLVVVNAINFIDGIDGLAISQVIKTIVLIELISANSSPLIVLGGLTISCLLPLYYFNFKKRGKIFLGDGGSLLLGTIVMVYLLYLLGPNFILRPEFQINKALVSVLVVLYPLLDLLRVFSLRISKGESPFKADQNHIHHRLLNYFRNHLKTLIAIISLEAIIILIAKFLIN